MENNQQTSVQAYKPNLINALAQPNSQLQVMRIIRDFKHQNGAVNYPALFAIPSQHRLPKMVEENPAQAFQLCSAAITMAMETMNLARPMNAAQIAMLTDEILESAGEDNLSLEDLVLFLQKLVRGEYGAMYEGMDIPKFLLKFEQYRDERFRAIQSVRDEQAANYKPSYHEIRLSEQTKADDKRKHLEAMVNYTSWRNEK